MPRVACSAAAPSLLFVRNNELVSRLGATLLLICLARLGHFIPIPGAYARGSAALFLQEGFLLFLASNCVCWVTGILDMHPEQAHR